MEVPVHIAAVREEGTRMAAAAGQTDPDQPVERLTGDGTLVVRLVPLAVHSKAKITTDLGTFSGRDHLLLIRRT